MTKSYIYVADAVVVEKTAAMIIVMSGHIHRHRRRRRADQTIMSVKWLDGRPEQSRAWTSHRTGAGVGKGALCVLSRIANTLCIITTTLLLLL